MYMTKNLSVAVNNFLLWIITKSYITINALPVLYFLNMLNFVMVNVTFVEIGQYSFLNTSPSTESHLFVTNVLRLAGIDQLLEGSC